MDEDQSPCGGVSRRRFLQTATTAAALPAVAVQAQTAARADAASIDTAPAPSATQRTVRLSVNGVPRELRIEARVTLLDALREAMVALSALAHFTVTGPGWASYQRQLGKSRNPFRWLEYSLSASIMIVLIAMLVGINDIAALVVLVGVNAAMIGCAFR